MELHEIKRKYGINFKERNAILTKQGSVCAICGDLISFKIKENFNVIKKAIIDHNHKTGKVRGILCSYCNIGLGCFKDNKDILKNAIKYL